jgi:hypothetical protein
MINTKMIWQLLSMAEHLFVLVLLVCVYILYSTKKIQRHTIHIYRQKVKDLVAEIMALEKEKNNDR